MSNFLKKHGGKIISFLAVVGGTVLTQLIADSQRKVDIEEIALATAQKVLKEQKEAH